MSCLEVDTNKIYVGDVGTAIILDTGEDLTDATSLVIEALKPGSPAVVLTWNGALFELTKIRYVTQAGDISVSGGWRLQAKVAMPSGSWYGETVRMTIHKRWQ